MIRPPYLKEGDKVAIVSPAGAVVPELIDEAADVLISWGLVPVLGITAKGRHGRFAGTDDERLNDLQWAMDDPSVRAILCGRGGYGVVRIVSKLNFSRFIEAPKWIIGFSDITALHAAIVRNGVMSMHGPMAKALAHSQSSGNSEAVMALKQMLFNEASDKIMLKHSDLNRQGSAEGVLVGGNLSVLYGLRGTPLDIQPQGKILFIEDIAERPYHIDRMMQNLKMGGILSQISGLLVGQFSDIEEDASVGQTVREIVASAVAEYDYPVAFNFPVGHETTNMPIVHGATISLNVKVRGRVGLEYR